MRCLIRCPAESGALFLYRKLESVPEPVLLAAPALKASEEGIEEWLQQYNALIESVDPEVAAKKAEAEAAAPAEGAEEAAAAAGACCCSSSACQKSFSDHMRASRKFKWHAHLWPVTWRRGCTWGNSAGFRACTDSKELP